MSSTAARTTVAATPDSRLDLDAPVNYGLTDVALVLLDPVEQPVPYQLTGRGRVVTAATCWPWCDEPVRYVLEADSDLGVVELGACEGHLDLLVRRMATNAGAQGLHLTQVGAE